MSWRDALKLRQQSETAETTIQNIQKSVPTQAVDVQTLLRGAQRRVSAAFLYWNIGPRITDADRETLSRFDQELEERLLQPSPEQHIKRWEEISMAHFSTIFRNRKPRITVEQLNRREK
jgi:single-stranded DNA-specific DHH superfamily exonuclease